MSDATTFWTQEAEPKRSRQWLRRYSAGYGGGDYTCASGWHEARSRIEDAPTIVSEEGYSRAPEAAAFDGDDRWPAYCANGCGYEFRPEDNWQVFTKRVYVRPDTGEEMTIEDAPPGAMWDAWWYPWKGPDGLSLNVVCPNGQSWSVDHRASNCTMPDDNVHRCWVRHGDPRTERVTVDKNGLTCEAGAGSISIGDGDKNWHGFLRDGELVR